MPWKLDDKIINEGRSWVDKNNIRHPTNLSIWTDDQKKAVGLAWADPSPQEAPFDNRFYTGRKANGDLIEKSLADVKWVDKDGEAVKLFASYDREEDGSLTFGDRTMIPLACVKKMVKIQ